MHSNEKTHSLLRSRPSSKALAALVAVAVMLAAPASAGARLLVETYNEGLQPHAVLGGHSASVNNPSKIRVEFLSSYKAELTGRFKIQCRGFSKSYTLTGVSPATRTVKLRGGLGSCRVATATAHWTDPLLQGWIQIRAWGK